MGCGHYLIVCKNKRCGKVISQCRCISFGKPGKQITGYDICDECKAKAEKRKKKREEKKLQ